MPVLLGPVLNGLEIKASGYYVDATFGRGGHSRAMLQKLGPGGRLIGIDRDPDAIAAAPKGLSDDPRFELIRGECARLEKFMDERDLLGNVDGILFDLGVSSPQLDDASRGFSFLRDGPLDMRMDPDSGLSAKDWIAAVDVRELMRVLSRYGEEPQAVRIAHAICDARAVQPITTTTQLADIVVNAIPARARTKKKHPATRVFQALRIVVNDELGQLEKALEGAVRCLKKGGRLCVISFHSLEDRLVKRFLRDAAREPEQFRGLPTIPEQYRPRLALVGKAIAPDAAEINANRRARSARLRVAKRL